MSKIADNLSNYQTRQVHLFKKKNLAKNHFSSVNSVPHLFNSSTPNNSLISKFNNKSISSTDIVFGGFFNSMGDKILKSPVFNKVLKSAKENPSWYESIVALVVTTTIRPSTILVTPGAEKKDKQYAAAQSIASGLTGLGMGLAAFKPIDKAIDNVLKKANEKPVEDALQNLFKDDHKAKALIDELNQNNHLNGVFNVDLKAGNLYKQIEDNIKKQYKTIDKNFEHLSEDAKEAFRDKLNKLNNYIKQEFQSATTKMSEAEKKTTQHLFHETILLSDTGKKLEFKPGEIASNLKFRTSYATKFVLFPVLAAATIGLIPPIMKKVFPNLQKHKEQKKNNNIQQVQQQFLYTRNLKNNTPAVFNQFTSNIAKQKLANNKQVAFTGGLKSVSSKLNDGFQKYYNKPVANLLSKLFEKIFVRENFKTKIMEAHNLNKIVDKSGKEKNKYTSSFLHKHLPEIVAVWGTSLYITRTLGNDKIEKDRKPTLCLNMGIVAAFSTFVGNLIKKAVKPLEDNLAKKHEELMGKKVNYNIKGAWNLAFKIATVTLAFRYLGPVFATPAADKLTKFLQNKGIIKKPEEKSKMQYS